MHPKWVPEIFARPKSVPVELRFGCPANSSLRHVPGFIVDALVESPERIKKLKLFDRDGSFLKRLTKPTPLLESLIVDLRCWPTTFPPDFLGGVAPRLHSINCTATLPQNASWLESLRHLEYSGMLEIQAKWLSKLTSLHLGNKALINLSIDALLSALENAPLLQRIHIVAPTLVDDTPSRRSKPVHLHYLCDIAVDLERNPAMAAIFSHLRVDSIERLHTSWPRETSMLEYACHFFKACYHGDTLQYLFYNKYVLYGNSIGPSHTPCLCFSLSIDIDPAIIVNLLHQWVPCTLDAFYAMAPVLTEWDSVTELRFARNSSLYPLLNFDDNSSVLYPSLLRLHFKGTSSICLKSKQIPRLKRWLGRREPKIEVVINNRAAALSTTDVESLRETAVVRFL